MAFSDQFIEIESIKALTLNNWGCYYRREGEEEKALTCF
jgi:hypothetical protein